MMMTIKIEEMVRSDKEADVTSPFAIDVAALFPSSFH